MNVATLQEPSQIVTTVGIQLLPLRVRSGRLELLHAPGLPSGMLPQFGPDEREDVRDAVRRFGQEILSGEGHALQLGVEGSPASGLLVTYLYLVRPPVAGNAAGTPIAGFNWRDVRRIPLGDDDREAVDRALARLGTEIEHSTAGFQLVGAEFTVSELRQVHEAVLRVSLDPSNFRKRVCRQVKEGQLVELSTRRPTATRPARLYRTR